MANKCGECQFYQGSSKSCDVGKGPYSASTSAPYGCFKGPASLFKNKVCGGCRLYQGPNQRCGGSKGPYPATSPAPSSCYAPIPG